MVLFRTSLILSLLILGNLKAQQTVTDSALSASGSDGNLEIAKKKKSPNGQTYALPLQDDPAETGTGKKNSVVSKALVLYNKNAYSEAIPYFEKAAEADSTNIQLLEKLGDCYRLTNNTSGKIRVYRQLLASGSSKPIHELYYGQALVENGEYELAKPYFEKFGADSRGKNLASSFGKGESYTRYSDAYNLTPASFNSPQNDFCAVKFNNAIVFASTRKKNSWIAQKQGWTSGEFMHVYATEKDHKGLEKKPVKFLKDLDTKFNDGPVCFNKDFYLIYYTTNYARKSERARDGSYKLRILEGELDENGLALVKQPAFINKEYNYVHPSLSADGKTLFFASDMDGGLGGMDIYRSEKDSVGDWGPAINMGDKVNTAGNEVFPFIAPNGALYFSSNGWPGMGGLDIYEARLKGTEVSRIYNMGEPVNSRFDDFGYYMGEDNINGFVSSNRKSGGMDDDIYNLQMLKEVKRGKDILIVSKDKQNGVPIPNVRMLLGSDTIITNEKGEYLAMLEAEQVVSIKTLKEDYFEVSDTLSALSSTADAFTHDVVMEKNPKLFLRALITDAKSNELLSGVNIRIFDLAEDKEIDRFTTTDAGDYFKFLFSARVGDQINYLIKLDKKGYLERSVVFIHTIEKPGEINMNDHVNLTLGKVEVGMDLGKLIDLQPIYFEKGKSELTPEARQQLDKIIEVMNDYVGMFIELGSHTDCRSSAASNMKLSTERAKASVKYIVEGGINKMRITARGYGETRLLNNCGCEGAMKSDCPEEEHAKNRRTEFVITKLN